MSRRVWCNERRSRQIAYHTIFVWVLNVGGSAEATSGSACSSRSRQAVPCRAAQRANWASSSSSMVVKVDSPRIAASIKLIAGGIETAGLLLERLAEPSARPLGAPAAIYGQLR